jgi:hypothetical protein
MPFQFLLQIPVLAYARAALAELTCGFEFVEFPTVGADPHLQSKNQFFAREWHCELTLASSRA